MVAKKPVLFRHSTVKQTSFGVVVNVLVNYRLCRVYARLTQGRLPQRYVTVYCGSYFTLMERKILFRCQLTLYANYD